MSMNGQVRNFIRYIGLVALTLLIFLMCENVFGSKYPMNSLFSSQSLFTAVCVSHLACESSHVVHSKPANDGTADH